MNTGGSWNGVHSWASPTSETINGSVEYHYKLSFDTNSRIAYRTIDKTWYDANTSSQPSALSSDAFSTQSLALVNPQYVWIGDTSATNTDFYLSFDNPYYEAPVLNWWEDGYGALPVITGTGALNGQSFSFHAEDSTHIEFIILGTESNPSTIKFTKADGSWVDGTSGDWPSQVNYDSTNVILRTNTWSNEFVNPNTSSPYTP